MLKSSWLLFILSMMVLSCGPSDPLQKAIDRELARDIRNDSLFLGVRLGMARQDFYDHCWDLNKQEVVSEGPNNMSVQYLFKDSLDQPIAFNFYPEFTGQIAYKYKTSIGYYAWAPWNRHLWSNKMIEVLDEILMDWYGGNESFAIQKDNKTYYYKIDGNRAIEYYIQNDQLVAMNFYDLTNYKTLGQQ